MGCYYLAVNSYFDLQIMFLALVVKSYRKVLHKENVMFWKLYKGLEVSWWKVWVPFAVFLISLIIMTSLKHQRQTTNGEIQSVPANEVPKAHSTNQPPLVLSTFDLPIVSLFPLIWTLSVHRRGFLFQSFAAAFPFKFWLFLSSKSYANTKTAGVNENKTVGCTQRGGLASHLSPSSSNCQALFNPTSLGKPLPSQRLWSSPNHQSTELLLGSAGALGGLLLHSPPETRG